MRRTFASCSSSREVCSSSRVRCSVSRMRRSSSCSSSSREEGSVCTSTDTRSAAGPNGLSGLNGGGGGKDAGSGRTGRSRSSSLALRSWSRESSSCWRVSRSSVCIARKSASVTRDDGLALIIFRGDVEHRPPALLPDVFCLMGLPMFGRRFRDSITVTQRDGGIFFSSGELDAPRAGSLSCVSWQRNKSAGAAFAGQRPHGVSLHARHLSEAQPTAATATGPARGLPASLPVPPLRRPLAPCPAGPASPWCQRAPAPLGAGLGCCVN